MKLSAKNLPEEKSPAANAWDDDAIDNAVDQPAVDQPAAETPAATEPKVESITIPFRKSVKVSAVIHVRRFADGVGWEYAADWTRPDGMTDGVSFDGTPDVKTTKAQAIDAAVACVIDQCHEFDDDIITDCQRFLDQFGDGQQAAEAAAEATDATEANDTTTAEVADTNGAVVDGPTPDEPTPDDGETRYTTTEAYDFTRARAEHELKLQDAMQDVCRCLDNEDDARDALKAAKNETKEARIFYRSLKKNPPALMPLFDREPSSNGHADSSPDTPLVAEASTDEQPAEAVDADAPAANGTEQSLPTSAEAWRSVPIEELVNHGLSEATALVLSEQGIETIGHLADWNRNHNSLTTLKKIGKAKAEKIEEAMESFWKANPQPAEAGA